MSYALSASLERARYEVLKLRLMAGHWRRRLNGVCDARAKSTGAPCRATAIRPGGRCRLHGGLSSGPKTPEGKQRSAANLQRWRDRDR